MYIECYVYGVGMNSMKVMTWNWKVLRPPQSSGSQPGEGRQSGSGGGGVKIGKEDMITIVDDFNVVDTCLGLFQKSWEM